MWLQVSDREGHAVWHNLTQSSTAIKACDYPTWGPCCLGVSIPSRLELECFSNWNPPRKEQCWDVELTATTLQSECSNSLLHHDTMDTSNRVSEKSKLCEKIRTSEAFQACLTRTTLSLTRVRTNRKESQITRHPRRLWGRPASRPCPNHISFSRRGCLRRLIFPVRAILLRRRTPISMASEVSKPVYSVRFPKTSATRRD